MIAVAPHFDTSYGENREYEYLLMGDLRQTLEEPIGPQTSRWLLAILDVILVGRARVRPTVYLPVEPDEDSFRLRTIDSGGLIDKLRRLRDRIAHRGNYSGLANEIREELREVMSDRMSSAACLYDA